MKIRRLLLVTFFVMTFIPLIVVTLVYVHSMANIVMAGGKKELESSAKLYSASFENYILKQQKQLIILSNAEDVIEVLKYPNPLLEDAFTQRDIADILYFNQKEGHLDNISLFNNKGELVLGQVSESRLFFSLLNAKMPLVKPYSFYYVSFNKVDKSAVLWALALPIYREGSYKGYILSTFDSSFFNQVHREEGLGLVFFDEKGNPIGNNNISKLEEIPRAEGVHLDEENRNYVAQQIDFDDDGIKNIGYYSPVGETGWGFLLFQAKKEFFTPIKRAVGIIPLSTILILLSIVLINFFVIDYICKPLNTILNAMRRIDGGDYNERVGMGKYIEYNEIANVFNALISKLVSKKISLADINLKLEALTENIPGGTQCCYNDEHFTISYLSGGFLELTGYSRGEIIRVFNNRYAELIHAPDREKTVKKVQEQLQKGNNIEVEYRILRKDGTLRWVLDKGRLVKEKDGQELFYCVIVDITSQKESIENLRLSEERYRLVTEQTDSIIFECNIISGLILLSPIFNKVFGYNFGQKVTFEDILSSGLIYPEDQAVFRQNLFHLDVGKSFVEFEIRMRKEKGEYIWCLIQATTLFDSEGYPLRSIGKVKDIDNKKKEIESLKLKAQQDLLTGLYNKEYASFLVSQYLEQADKTKDNAALFIVDIDDFKSINDDYGHLAGDGVLTDIGKLFKQLFRNSDIVGRIGGDEFMFFIKYLEDEKIIIERANRVCQAFSRISIEGNKSFRLSGSIGIARFPQDGITFKELYNKADIALYKAKEGGKNCFAIYSDYNVQD